ncbi:hypothetical protein AVEN_66535-1 [Araneus ventricosus]|uniref:Uncharacterized protein n=1 Tax=Araneus ventricosus TaxID=182803 RepID=A0A4Y2EBK3_ARAVE|nr:hypothetical protein AVEN_66535-1 [Araneus ventricosus]
MTGPRQWRSEGNWRPGHNVIFPTSGVIGGLASANGDRDIRSLVIFYFEKGHKRTNVLSPRRPGHLHPLAPDRYATGSQWPGAKVSTSSLEDYILGTIPPTNRRAREPGAR